MPRSERAARVARGRRMAVMKRGRWRGWQHEPQDGRGSQPIVGGQGEGPACGQGHAEGRTPSFPEAAGDWALVGRGRWP